MPELKADRWSIAQTREFYSSDSSYFVRIVPIEIPKRYYKWKNAPNWRKKMFSPADTTIIPCYAEMYKSTTNGDSLVWTRKLVNTIAPVSAKVSNDGRYMVTLDDWGGNRPTGENAVVIYGVDGNLLKQYSLLEISPFPLDSYDVSVTSFHWYGGSSFIDNKSFRLYFKTKIKQLYNFTYYIDSQELR